LQHKNKQRKNDVTTIATSQELLLRHQENACCNKPIKTIATKKIIYCNIKNNPLQQ
jgi:hypothetical protein